MIIRREIKHGFTAMPRAAFEDTRLTYEARGLLAYILVKPDNWRIHVTDLARQAGPKGCGKDRVYRILGELKATGYMVFGQGRGKGGRMSAGEYIVSDIPAEVADCPDTAFPDTVEPGTEKPDAYQILTYTNYELQPKTKTASAPSGAGGPPPSAETGTPSPMPVAKADRQTTPWEELGRDIAEALTGDGEKAFVKRGQRAGRLQAWVGDIVGMVGKAAADKPIAAYDVWLAFQESIPPEEWARYISRHNVGDRFGKWAQNGGQASIQAAVAADAAWEERAAS